MTYNKSYGTIKGATIHVIGNFKNCLFGKEFSITMSEITLYTADGASKTFDNKEEKLDAPYVKAKVTKGLWILYDDERFHDDCFHDANVQVLKPEGKVVDLSLQPKSMLAIVENNPSITVFATKNYGGGPERIITCFNDQFDITNHFPPGVGCGASSFIVIDSEWNLYKKKNFDGPAIRLGSGEYPKPEYQDQIQSLERVKQ